MKHVFKPRKKRATPDQDKDKEAAKEKGQSVEAIPDDGVGDEEEEEKSAEEGSGETDDDESVMSTETEGPESSDTEMSVTPRETDSDEAENKTEEADAPEEDSRADMAGTSAEADGHDKSEGAGDESKLQAPAQPGVGRPEAAPVRTVVLFQPRGICAKTVRYWTYGLDDEDRKEKKEKREGDVYEGCAVTQEQPLTGTAPKQGEQANHGEGMQREKCGGER